MLPIFTRNRPARSNALSFTSRLYLPGSGRRGQSQGTKWREFLTGNADTRAWVCAYVPSKGRRVGGRRGGSKETMTGMPVVGSIGHYGIPALDSHCDQANGTNITIPSQPCPARLVLATHARPGRTPKCAHRGVRSDYPFAIREITTARPGNTSRPLCCLASSSLAELSASKQDACPTPPHPWLRKPLTC